jgi:DNA polymerase-3 subunit beta
MKIQVERDVLAAAVAWTARALPARPAAPVLAGMRLQAGDDLTLSSFDYDVSAQAAVPVLAERAGSALVSGRLLAEISHSLPARPVQITAEDGRAVLSCGSATFTLLTMPEEEYPALPQMPQPAGNVGSDAFATAVSQVATAAGRDDTLPALTGIRIEIDGGTLTFVATDRYRLAVRELRWTPARADVSAAVLVPARALADTARSLTSAAEVAIALGVPGETPAEGAEGGDGMIGFAADGRQATTRLLGGEFPRHRALLPSHARATAEMPTAVLAEAVKRVALVAERNTAVRLTFAPGQLLLEAGSGEQAQAAEVLEADFAGDDTVALNPQFLLDGLTAIGSDMAQISFTEPGKPVLITGKPGPDGHLNFRYLLMPIRFGS